jgi:hypothetical protein
MAGLFVPAIYVSEFGARLSKVVAKQNGRGEPGHFTVFKLRSAWW